MRFLLQLLYTIYALFVIATVLLAFIPLGYTVAAFSTDKSAAWYGVGFQVLSLIRRLLFIRVHVEGEEHIPDEPVIFAANHEGFFDGVFFNFIRQKQLVALTAPFPYFPHIFSFWLKMSGCVDVARDFSEEAIYTNANHHSEVYGLLKRALKNGKDVLIFPEGHAQRHPKLQPFHWGAVRLGMMSDTPIVPATIRGTRRFFHPHKKMFWPVTVHVSFHKPFKTSDLQQSNFMIENLMTGTLELERRIAHHLPRSMVPPRIHIYSPPPPEVAVAFFDIDRTLFPGYVDIMVAKYLFNIGALPLSVISQIMYWYFLEKRGKLNHLEVLPEVAKMFTGWSRAELEQVAIRVFKKQIAPKLYEEAKEIIRLHQEHNHKVVLISETFSLFLLPWAEYLKVDAVYGTPLEDVDGILTGNLAGPLAYSHGKKHYAQHYLKENNSSFASAFAYGDSFGDAQLLMSVRHPYAVNPKKNLIKVAHRHDIPVISFSHSGK